MGILYQKEPKIFDEFLRDGNFVISDTENVFSSMAIDQRHEQLNKDRKGDRGIVGLTVDQDNCNRGFVCTPGVTRVTVEFESQTFFKNNEHRQDFNNTKILSPFKHNFKETFVILENNLNRLEHILPIDALIKKNKLPLLKTSNIKNPIKI